MFRVVGVLFVLGAAVILVGNYAGWTEIAGSVQITEKGKQMIKSYANEARDKTTNKIKAWANSAEDSGQ
jgi:hypothetical protein